MLISKNKLFCFYFYIICSVISFNCNGNYNKKINNPSFQQKNIIPKKRSFSLLKTLLKNITFFSLIKSVSSNDNLKINNSDLNNFSNLTNTSSSNVFLKTYLSTKEPYYQDKIYEDFGNLEKSFNDANFNNTKSLGFHNDAGDNVMPMPINEDEMANDLCSETTCKIFVTVIATALVCCFCHYIGEFLCKDRRRPITQEINSNEPVSVNIVQGYPINEYEFDDNEEIEELDENAPYDGNFEYED